MVKNASRRKRVVSAIRTLNTRFFSKAGYDAFNQAKGCIEFENALHRQLKFAHNMLVDCVAEISLKRAVTAIERLAHIGNSAFFNCSATIFPDITEKRDSPAKAIFPQMKQD